MLMAQNQLILLSLLLLFPSRDPFPLVAAVIIGDTTQICDLLASAALNLTGTWSG